MQEHHATTVYLSSPAFYRPRESFRAASGLDYCHLWVDYFGTYTDFDSEQSEGAWEVALSRFLLGVHQSLPCRDLVWTDMN